MPPTEIDQTLAEIFQLILGGTVPASDLTREAVPAWDSLKHLEIIFAVEAAFGVTFSPEEMAAVRCLGDIRRKLLGSDAP